MTSRARLCMTALGEQLPHPGIHDRVSGSSLLPRFERVGVVPPVVVARALVVAWRSTVGREQLVVEVAPAELADEGLAARLRPRTLDDLERREAAQVEVRREP